MHICIANSFVELMKSLYLLKTYRTNLLICTKRVFRDIYLHKHLFIFIPRDAKGCQVDQIADKRTLIIQIHYTMCFKF